jgi:tetraacyldisaccharide 4'-kinase
MNAFSDTMLAPFGVVYGAVSEARAALYRTGALRSYKIEAPVISVGNITTGGSGKTPLVEWIARSAAREGRHPCVLTRGYGRVDPQRRVVVSDGESILSNAREGGDEPFLLAEKLLGTAAVISDRDRVAAARWALENLRSDLFLLDDGFQHLRIKRNLDIVTLDATNPFGEGDGKGRMLPRGRLREPIAALARADCIIITRADMIDDANALRAQMQALTGVRKILFARAQTTAVHPLSSSEKESPSNVNDSLPQPVAAFCALGNPQAFFAHLARSKYQLSYTRSFRDHHVYTQEDVDALVREGAQNGARTLMTTAKDAVKLRALHFALPCYVIEIAVEFNDEEALLVLLREAMR